MLNNEQLVETFPAFHIFIRAHHLCVRLNCAFASFAHCTPSRFCASRMAVRYDDSANNQPASSSSSSLLTLQLKFSDEVDVMVCLKGHDTEMKMKSFLSLQVNQVESFLIHKFATFFLFCFTLFKFIQLELLF